jgi:hypothetical protein
MSAAVPDDKSMKRLNDPEAAVARDHKMMRGPGD